MALTPEEQKMYDELQGGMSSFSMPPPVSSPMQEIAQTMDETSPSSVVMQMLQDYAPMAGEIGGAIIGGIQGAKKGTTYQPIPQLKVPSAVVGGVVGAMTGRGIGETVADAAGDEFDPLDTVTEMAKAGAFELAGAGVFAAVGQGYRAIKNYRAGKELTEQEIKSIVELQKVMQQNGTTLTPAQITKSGWQTTLDKITTVGLGSEAKMRNTFMAQNNALKKVFEQEVAMLGDASREGAGKAFQNAIEQVENELITWAKPQYAEIDKLAGKEALSFQSMEQWIRGKMVSSGTNLRPNKFKTASIDDMLSMKTRLAPEMEKELKTLLLNSRNITYSNAFDDIKRITGELRKLQGNKLQPNKELEQFYTTVLDRYHTMLGKQAEKSGTAVYDKYKEVSGVYRGAMENLRSDAVLSLINKAPEAVGETVWATGNVDLVNKAYRAIYDAAETAKKVGGKPVDVADLKGRFKAGYVDNLFKQVQSEMTDSAATKSSSLYGKIIGDPKYRDTFNAVLSKEERGRLKMVLGWGQDLEKSAAGNWSLMIRGQQSAGIRQTLQAVGIAGVAGFDPVLAASGLAIALSPNLLAKWAVSGKASNKAVAKLGGLYKKFEAGKWDPIRDGGALATIIGTMPLRNEDLPEDMRHEGLTGSEAYMYEQLMQEAPEYQLLPPARNAR